MENLLKDFESSETEHGKLRNTIIVLVCIWPILLWTLQLGNLLENDLEQIDLSDSSNVFLLGVTISYLAIVYLFAKRKKIGWLILAIINSLCLGLLLKTNLLFFTDEFGTLILWRVLILVAMPVVIISSLILLFHFNISRNLALGRLFYAIALVLAVIGVAIGFSTDLS